MSEQWNSDNDDVQMPLGVGTGETEFTPEAGESKPKMNGPTMVLFAAFAAGLLVIYLLGMKSKPRMASADQLAREAQVKSAIAELLGKNGKAAQLDSLFKDTDKLMKMFHAYFGADGQAAPALEHDPFANDEAQPAPSPAMEAARIVNASGPNAEQLRRIAETFSTLKLKSVFLAGRNSLAIINRRTVSVGQKIDDLTVERIEADRVILSYGGKEFVLKLAGAQLDSE